jgi:transcriptional regulator with XRE-family HTH domain
LEVQVVSQPGSQSQSWTGRQLLITLRLRERRCELGLTQKQVVTRLGRVGVHTTNRALSSLEHGTGVDAAKLPELAIALDCTVTYLFGLTDDPHQWEPDHDQVVDLTDRGVQRGNLNEVPRQPRPSWILGSEIPDRSYRLGSSG